MSTKKRKAEASSSNSEVDSLREEVASLQKQLKSMASAMYPCYANPESLNSGKSYTKMADEGMLPRTALDVVRNNHLLDCKEALNTSSYVNVIFEPEEEEVMKMGIRVNLADQTVYPQSYKLHDMCVDQIANLWNCPFNEDEYKEYGVHAGAGTVGSTEACLLGALALKFRWREWYAEKHGMDANEVRGVYPNLVISTMFQAAWEKVFKYLDVEPRFVVPKTSTFTITAEDVKDKIDEKTMGVVCIMGNHYAGQYDPVWDVDAMLTKLNKEKGYQVGIHVDGASGGFIAPFQKCVKPWDFRLANVLSISASGHKFGESCCGTGWVVWRQRKGLSEHVAISVTYLGGKADSYTLNFSRPASGVYVQFYKFLRLGMLGYQRKVDNMMHHCKTLRNKLKSMTKDGKPRFVMLDAGDTGCLPVVAARINPDLQCSYNDIDLQHKIAEDHWYVSGYKLCMNHPLTEKQMPLTSDTPQTEAMFRVVVKSNVDTNMIENLMGVFESSIEWLDEHYKSSVPHKLYKHRPTC